MSVCGADSYIKRTKNNLVQHYRNKYKIRMKFTLNKLTKNLKSNCSNMNNVTTFYKFTMINTQVKINVNAENKINLQKIQKLYN